MVKNTCTLDHAATALRMTTEELLREFVRIKYRLVIPKEAVDAVLAARLQELDQPIISDGKGNNPSASKRKPAMAANPSLQLKDIPEGCTAGDVRQLEAKLNSHAPLGKNSFYQWLGHHGIAIRGQKKVSPGSRYRVNTFPREIVFQYITRHHRSAAVAQPK